MKIYTDVEVLELLDNSTLKAVCEIKRIRVTRNNPKTIDTRTELENIDKLNMFVDIFKSTENDLKPLNKTTIKDCFKSPSEYLHKCKIELLKESGLKKLRPDANIEQLLEIYGIKTPLSLPYVNNNIKEWYIIDTKAMEFILDVNMIEKHNAQKELLTVEQTADYIELLVSEHLNNKHRLYIDMSTITRKKRELFTKFLKE